MRPLLWFRRAIVGVLLLGPTPAAQPQASHFVAADFVHGDFVHRAWRTHDGLPVNNVSSLLQSRDGYLWVGTFDGLVRFDGDRFVTFTTSDTEGLPSNRIAAMEEAADGTLWLRTSQDLLVRHDGREFTTITSAHGLGAEECTLMYRDRDDVLWLGTKLGVARYTGGRIERPYPDLPELYVRDLLASRDGSFWIATQSRGLLRLRGSELTILDEDTGLSSNHVERISEDRDGTLWISTLGGLHLYRDGELEELASDDPALSSLALYFHHDVSGAHWIGNQTGLYRYRPEGSETFDPSNRNFVGRRPAIQRDGEGRQWIHFGHRVYRDGELVFEGARVTAFLHDQEGSHWIGTETDGLHRLRPSSFRVIGREAGLASANVYSIVESASRPGTLWLTTLGGGAYSLRDGRAEKIATGNSVLDSHPWSVLEDRQGRLWIGGQEGNVCRYDDAFERSEVCRRDGLHPLLDGTPFHGGEVRALYQDRRGRIWIGTLEGLLSWDGVRWQVLTTEQGLPHDAVVVISESPDGALWIGTNGGGLARYTDAGLDHLTADDGLASDLVRSLYVDAEGWMWVGTEDQGLCRFRPGDFDARERPEVDCFNQRDGLFDNVIHQILEDDQGRLWMNSNRGVFWVRRRELDQFAAGELSEIHSVGYDEGHGLTNREGNGGVQSPGIRSADGRLWFPTQDGVAVIDPAEVRPLEPPPPIHVEEIRSRDRSWTAATALRLEPEQRDFQIRFTAVTFVDPDRVRFRYRLEGYEETWHEGAERQATYTNIPPGSYVFRVTGSNADGVWNREGASLRLRIDPYYHETPWFYGLVALTLGLAVAGLVGWRSGHARARARQLSALVSRRTRELEEEKRATERALETVAEQAEALRSLDRAKSRFFANVSHEFRTPLTLTLGPLEDLHAGLHGRLSDDALRQVDLAARNSRRLLRLTNELLDIAKLEAGEMKLDVRPADLTAFLRDLAQAFAPLAESRGITFPVDLPRQPVLAELDAGKLEVVFTNLLSNAFKFTPEGGTVRLGLQLIPPTPQGALRVDDGDDGGTGADLGVRVTVRDNGPGIAADQLPHVFERFYQVDERDFRRGWRGGRQPGTGIGLSLAQELVELHGGSIEVESEEGFGSTFAVILRLRRAGTPERVPAAAARERVAELLAAGTRTSPAHDAQHSDAQHAEHDDGEDGEDRTTVLVVDDNAEVRAFVAKHLQAVYRVVEAADGAEALALARALPPDLIVSDVMMPEMDGNELCAALRQDPEFDFIPVILLTAKATTQHTVEGLDAGADDYLAKPFHPEELQARVRNLIASRQRLRDRLRAERTKRPVLRATEVEVESTDDAFLQRVRDVVEAHLANEDFTVERLAGEVAHSRVHLFRRLRDLVGLAPSEVIWSIRLERAAQLLAGGAGSVGDVAYAVGFKSVSHFSRRFRGKYGMTPSAYKAGS